MRSSSEAERRRRRGRRAPVRVRAWTLRLARNDAGVGAVFTATLVDQEERRPCPKLPSREGKKSASLAATAAPPSVGGPLWRED